MVSAWGVIRQPMNSSSAFAAGCRSAKVYEGKCSERY